MPFTTINPATERRIAVYPTHTAADVARRLDRAAAAQRRWRKPSPAERATPVRELGRVLRQRATALAHLATEEMGKPVTQAVAEVEKCAALCDYYAAQGPALLLDQHPPGAPARSRVAFEPLGVLLAIMPWNFPFWQVMRAAVPALLAGNAVLLKHAPNVPGCALAIEALFQHAGFPPAVFQTLLVDTRVTSRLIGDARVTGVTLTGSTHAGRAVAALAGAALTPAVLELGGSDPIVVLDDADLDAAAELAAESRLLNSGQSCICGKRIIVLRSVRRAFESRLVARVAARRVGDPTDPANAVGPLARADLRETLEAQVRRSLRRGAKPLLAGGARSGRGFFYDPTILTGVTPGMAVFDEETFGPVAAVVPARHEAEAIRLANATSFGLGAVLVTRDPDRARRLAPQLEAGCVFVNKLVRSSPELPFGGIKQSGFGRELGAWGAHAFTNIKTVVGA
ncbi:aldehyde dehydrogenase family protein [Opitutus sp. ER46]|uniref:aldehyde dehydrogenase family protein n=1 Tax=Opitutus sp. ER46 TaxID=2161864 RepID=UPI000D325FA9|nr:aldehyde dehydrogenase family protein [Opitutus sp. ER46]PTX97949.1 NADP-dependent succinic semialdehyde dehydrogenase [Opitutus sp. ER46]